MQRAPQDNQLMSKHRVLGFKPQLRLEWRGQDGQHETEQPDHSTSLGDSIAPSTDKVFGTHTSSTPTICRLPDSRRHQLSAIALGGALLKTIKLKQEWTVGVR